MKWPRGRHNGRRVTGFGVKLKIDLAHWNWKPVLLWRYTHGLHWLCFYTWFEWEYDFRRDR